MQIKLDPIKRTSNDYKTKNTGWEHQHENVYQAADFDGWLASGATWWREAELLLALLTGVDDVLTWRLAIAAHVNGLATTNNNNNDDV